ncbi:prolactin-like [Nannospalax galili]|uniref:prolactin-like n=1 Tax=Nannospalax galili TaxID=1026970 RepID=UPI0004ED09C5|nr:prolactin-like [Nannospalax galili]
MRLSLGQPLSWTFLLLLVSNLLLWENADSMAVCPSGEGYCQETLPGMFEDALTVSDYLKNQTAELLNAFRDDVNYASGRWYHEEASVMGCHTTEMGILLTPEEIAQTEAVLLLKEILTVLEAWKDPLLQATNKLNSMEDTPTAVVSIAEVVKAKINLLQEGIVRILKKISPVSQETVDIPVWKGLASLNSDDEDTRVFTFYNLFRCLKRDGSKIDYDLKHLKCQIVQDADC